MTGPNRTGYKVRLIILGDPKIEIISDNQEKFALNSPNPGMNLYLTNPVCDLIRFKFSDFLYLMTSFKTVFRKQVRIYDDALHLDHAYCRLPFRIDGLW